MKLKNLFFCLFLLPALSLFAENNEDNEDRDESRMHPFYEAYLWPNFCTHHLQLDPSVCSSWLSSTDKNGQKTTYLEESNFYLYPHAFISPDLIEKYQNCGGFELIPSLPNSKCDYALCKKCQKPVIRSFYWKKSTFFDEEEGKEVMRFDSRTLYKCDCLSDFIEKDEEAFKETVQGWTFCNHPACFSGYFDKYLSRYFDNFCTFTCYCMENPGCDCYWLEKTEFRSKILDLINVRFWEMLDERFYFDPKKAPYELVIKLLYVPIRRVVEHSFHSFFYTDLRDSLREFDRLVFRTAIEECALTTTVSQVRWDTFYEALLKELRRLYLDAYKECYEKHPHAKVAAEIKIILDEIENEDNFEMKEPSENEENQASSSFQLRRGFEKCLLIHHPCCD